MAKPGRNDPCPCGSGNKYKKCCLAKEEAAEREELAKVEARRAESAAAHRLHLQEARAAMVAGFAAEDDEEDELTIASNAAVDLVRAGKLDEAEQAARDLLVRFPEVHDGYDRLGGHPARSWTWPADYPPPLQGRPEGSRRFPSDRSGLRPPPPRRGCRNRPTAQPGGRSWA